MTTFATPRAAGRGWAVVFIHGYLGFDEFRLPFATIECFKGIKAKMAAMGVPVLAPQLPRNAGLVERADVLARFLDHAGHDRYALVGHSMGGLTSRLVAARLDGEKRIRAVVTVATPHRGSALAPHALSSNGPVYVLGRMIAANPLGDLTPEACARFNTETPDRPDVVYRSWAAARPLSEMPTMIRPWSRLLAADGGENDGQVTVTSAEWNGFQGTVRADHWELLGWSFAPKQPEHARPFDHLGFYEKIVGQVLRETDLAGSA